MPLDYVISPKRKYGTNQRRTSKSEMKVSVILSTHNSAAYIAESVNSILQQDFKDFELIVVNDGSRDDTAAILSSIEDPRLKTVDLPCPTGPATARNVGISMARDSEYLAIMDADDIALPDRLSRQVDYLDRHPQVTILGSRIRIFNANRDEEARAPEHPLEDGEIKARLLLLNGSALINPTMMIRNSFMRENVLFYPQPMRPIGEDHEFWINCVMRHARFAALADILLMKRSHEENLSKQTGDAFYAPRKTETRARLMGLYYPDLTAGEAKDLAAIFQERKSLTFEELCLAHAAALRALKDVKSHFGESKPLLATMIKAMLARRIEQQRKPG